MRSFDRLRTSLWDLAWITRKLGTERNFCFSVSFYMNKSFDEIRTEVLELDPESQRQLRDEIDRNLNSDQAGFHEAKRRKDAVDRGEMKTVDGREALSRVKKLISR